MLLKCEKFFAKPSPGRVLYGIASMMHLVQKDGKYRYSLFANYEKRQRNDEELLFKLASEVFTSGDWNPHLKVFDDLSLGKVKVSDENVPCYIDGLSVLGWTTCGLGDERFGLDFLDSEKLERVSSKYTFLVGFDVISDVAVSNLIECLVDMGKVLKEYYVSHIVPQFNGDIIKLGSDGEDEIVKLIRKRVIGERILSEFIKRVYGTIDKEYMEHIRYSPLRKVALKRIEALKDYANEGVDDHAVLDEFDAVCGAIRDYVEDRGYLSDE